MAPEIVFRPNKVPCGPRKNSTLSISATSVIIKFGLPITIPSRYIPSVVPIPGFLAPPSIPLIVKLATSGSSRTKTLGTITVKSSMEVAPISSIVSLRIATIEMGTSFMASSFFRAITVTSCPNKFP